MSITDRTYVYGPIILPIVGIIQASNAAHGLYYQLDSFSTAKRAIIKFSMYQPEIIRAEIHPDVTLY